MRLVARSGRCLGPVPGLARRQTWRCLRREGVACFVSHGQGVGVGSGKEGGGQSLERGECVRPGSARRATGSEPGGDASPGPLPGGRSKGEWLLLPPGWRSVGCCGLERRGGHFWAASARRWGALGSGVRLEFEFRLHTSGVTLGKYSHLSQLSFLVCPILLLGEFRG